MGKEVPVCLLQTDKPNILVCDLNHIQRPESQGSYTKAQELCAVESNVRENLMSQLT